MSRREDITACEVHVRQGPTNSIVGNAAGVKANKRPPAAGPRRSREGLLKRGLLLEEYALCCRSLNTWRTEILAAGFSNPLSLSAERQHLEELTTKILLPAEYRPQQMLSAGSC